MKFLRKVDVGLFYRPAIFNRVQNTNFKSYMVKYPSKKLKFSIFQLCSVMESLIVFVDRIKNRSSIKQSLKKIFVPFKAF